MQFQNFLLKSTIGVFDFQDIGARCKPVSEIRATLDSLRPIADLHWLQRMVEDLG